MGREYALSLLDSYKLEFWRYPDESREISGQTCFIAQLELTSSQGK